MIPENQWVFAVGGKIPARIPNFNQGAAESKTQRLNRPGSGFQWFFGEFSVFINWSGAKAKKGAICPLGGNLGYNQCAPKWSSPCGS